MEFEAETHNTYDSIPENLKTISQWLCWRRGQRNGKETKIPTNPYTGRNAKAPTAAWRFETAIQGVRDHHGDGLGISIRDGLIGLDYDHVLDEEGNLKPEYAVFLSEIQQINSYTEISPSGDGLHVLARCENIPPEWKDGGNDKSSGDPREFYRNGRFFTVTGNIWAKSPSREVNTVSASLLRPIYDRVVGGIKPTIDIEKEFGSRLDALLEYVAVWHPRDAFLDINDDASSHLMSITNLITFELRKMAFPVADDDLTFSIIKRLVMGSSVWEMYYAEGRGHDPAKLTPTIRKALEYNSTTGECGEEEDDDDEDTYDYSTEDEGIQALLERAPAPLRSLVAYFDAIAPIPQPLFSLASAVMLSGVVLARNWITERLDFQTAVIPPSTTNDYFTFIAPTGHGKDIIKAYVADALDNEYISPISGVSGRTALHKRLQKSPRTVLLIDEAGKHLSEIAGDKSGIKQGAETMMMEIYGSVGAIEPQEYSDGKDSPYSKRIKRHGLCVARLSTPETFIASVPLSALADGWMSRNILVASKRPRPKALGEYLPEGASDPKKLLEDWIAWRGAHIGLPDVDTYCQAINPITAVVWGYKAPDDIKLAAFEMRDKTLKYSTTRDIVWDDPLPIKWAPEAAEEIRRIYAEIEAVPNDNYTYVRYRKLSHIIKIAASIAVMRDGITKEALLGIYKKYADTEAGTKLMLDEIKRKAAYERAVENYEVLKGSRSQKREQILADAEKGVSRMMSQYLRTRGLADQIIRTPIRDEVSQKLQMTIVAADIIWACNFLDLIEPAARRLVIDELTNQGYTDALKRMIEYLKEHNGTATETRLVEKCASIRRLDERGLLKYFLDYVQDTGFVTCVRTNNRGRRWYLSSGIEKV